MSSKFRRFEILLPIKFNDGRNVPSQLIGIAFKELLASLVLQVMSLRIPKDIGSTKVLFT